MPKLELYLARDQIKHSPAWLYQQRPRVEGNEYLNVSGETLGPMPVPQELAERLGVQPGQLCKCTIKIETISD
ncbi:MAG: hypothetical protein RPU39_13640 [Candidatus Sedimenticola sp. (ex Thyasira tokunagai)]